MMFRMAAYGLSLSLILSSLGCTDETSSSTGTGAGGGATTSAGDGGQGGSTLDSGSTSSAGGDGGSTLDSGATTTSTSATTSSAQTGGGSIDGRLVGAWRPTQFSDSGNPPMPAGPNDPFFVFNDDGSFAFGCGAPANSTWTYTDGGPSPAIGVLDVLIGGSSMIKWYVTELTDTTFVFVEGGDVFYFERDMCP
jgi:hypothetical protein